MEPFYKHSLSEVLTQALVRSHGLCPDGGVRSLVDSLTLPHDTLLVPTIFQWNKSNCHFSFNHRDAHECGFIVRKTSFQFECKYHLDFVELFDVCLDNGRGGSCLMFVWTMVGVDPFMTKHLAKDMEITLCYSKNSIPSATLKSSLLIIAKST